MRPSAVTHTTDVGQRSVGPGLRKSSDTVPDDPPGWYMLFPTDTAWTPSVAKWVEAG